MALLSQHVLGVDIGHASVKVVGLALGRRPQFLGCKEITMDPKYLEKEGFADPRLIGQALQEAMRTAAPHAIVANEAYSTVSESLVFRKVVELPPLPHVDELEEAVRLEATQFLPDSLDNMYLDYQMLSSVGESGMQQVMVVAVPRKVIQDHLAVFSAAHIHIKGIGVKPGALGAALVRPNEPDAVMIVDIGSEVSTISVYNRRVIWVTAAINTGGNLLKDEDSGQVDEAHYAEKSKRLANALIDEIEHVQKFFLNRAAGTSGSLKGILLTGGGSMTVGLLEQIQSMTELQVAPGESVIAVPPFCDRRFIGALGSALSPLYEKL